MWSYFRTPVQPKRVGKRQFQYYCDTDRNTRNLSSSDGAESACRDLGSKFP